MIYAPDGLLWFMTESLRAALVRVVMYGFEREQEKLWLTRLPVAFVAA